MADEQSSQKMTTDDQRELGPRRWMSARLGVLIVCALVCVSPWGSPQVGLLLGVMVALAGLGAPTRRTRQVSKVLIQGCIVLLGLKTDLRQVWAAGASGLGFAAATVAGAFAVGLLLGRVLGVRGKLATLLCAGTAVCGGSAIAATSSVIRARETDTSISLACVFLLNAVALWVFPPLGRLLGLTEGQFGAWAAVAIHDVASVIGAGRAYGEVALQQATVIKLARVLWIIPIALVAGWWWRRRDSVELGEGIGSGVGAPVMKGVIPWFIVYFLAASALRTLMPALAEGKAVLDQVTRGGMSVALLLIGTGLSIDTLRDAGWRALTMATVLWLALSAAALLVVMRAVG